MMMITAGAGCAGRAATAPPGLIGTDKLSFNEVRS
jgi:hypothetical protein